jgi:hypothetical protein
MKVIPKMRHADYMCFLRFHCFNLTVNGVTMLLEGWMRNR